MPAADPSAHDTWILVLYSAREYPHKMHVDVLSYRARRVMFHWVSFTHLRDVSEDMAGQGFETRS